MQLSGSLHLCPEVILYTDDVATVKLPLGPWTRLPQYSITPGSPGMSDNWVERL